MTTFIDISEDELEPIAFGQTDIDTMSISFGGIELQMSFDQAIVLSSSLKTWCGKSFNKDEVKS